MILTQKMATKPHNLTQITHPPAILSLTDNTDYADVFITQIRDLKPHNLTQITQITQMFLSQIFVSDTLI